MQFVGWVSGVLDSVDATTQTTLNKLRQNNSVTNSNSDQNNEKVLRNYNNNHINDFSTSSSSLMADSSNENISVSIRPTSNLLLTNNSNTPTSNSSSRKKNNKLIVKSFDQEEIQNSQLTNQQAIDISSHPNISDKINNINYGYNIPLSNSDTIDEVKQFPLLNNYKEDDDTSSRFKAESNGFGDDFEVFPSSASSGEDTDVIAKGKSDSKNGSNNLDVDTDKNTPKCNLAAPIAAERISKEDVHSLNSVHADGMIISNTYIDETTNSQHKKLKRNGLNILHQSNDELTDLHEQANSDDTHNNHSESINNVQQKLNNFNVNNPNPTSFPTSSSPSSSGNDGVNHIDVDGELASLRHYWQEARFQLSEANKLHQRRMMELRDRITIDYEEKIKILQAEIEENRSATARVKYLESDLADLRIELRRSEENRNHLIDRLNEFGSDDNNRLGTLEEQLRMKQLEIQQLQVNHQSII